MPTMKLISFDALGAAPKLHEDAAAPVPGAGEVLVRVQASSVNPVDNAIAAGMLKDMVEHVFPVTLGRDYAGVVEEVGDGVTAFSAGDRAFGFVTAMAPAVHAGAWAERIVVPEGMSIAPVPEGVDLAVAGAAPLAAVTALMAVDALELSAGQTVLIAKDGGRVASATNAAGEGPGRTNVMATPTPDNLTRAAGYLADGTIAVHITKTYQLDEAPEALQALATDHTVGKLALNID